MAVAPSISRRKPSQNTLNTPSGKATVRPSSKPYSLPPQTPLSSSCETPNSLDRSLNGSRKRTRPGPAPVQSSSWSINTSLSNLTNVSADSVARSDAMSPPPLINTYICKGLETPEQELENRLDGEIAGEKDFRTRWAATEEPEAIKFNPQTPYEVATSDSPRSGWGKLVFNFAGAVAGKMWNFCSTVPFGGFYAGGGEGIALKLENHESLQQASSVWERIDTTFTTSTRDDFSCRTMTPIPGQYPVEDPFALSETSPPRPAKRMQTESSWMLVPDRGFGDCESLSRCASPARLAGRKTPSQSCIPRPSLPSQRPISNQSLPRRSLIPVSRRSSLNPPTQSPSSRPASRQSSYFAAKNTPTRPRCYTPSNPFAPHTDRPETPSQPSKENRSPLSPEVQAYTERLRYEEEVADESMRNMNQRLADLIREGQKALTSSYDGVDDEIMADDGY